ncbi:hypothetical protein B0H13DRAFT_1867788 [Mycena leptocephala]|nr:hypothetical protein B0H13DRAFT_1867788 [Mycena leptocephala]
MLALSKLSILLSSLVVLAVNAAPVGPPTPDLGTVFAIYPGWDMDNGSAQTILGGSEVQCMQACSSSSTCVAYAYVPYATPVTASVSACVLKNSVSLGTFKTQSFDVSVALVGACGTFAPVLLSPSNGFGHRQVMRGNLLARLVI